MQATILRTFTFPDIPSASGMEIVNDSIFIIGDDSAWLYILNNQFELAEKIPLFTGESFISGRIPKISKPDFESMTVLPVHGPQQLLIAGSGSLSPQRDVAFIIDTKPPYNHTQFSLTSVYNDLRSRPEIVHTGKLNIEGMAATHQQLFLLQRGNISGLNVLISYDLPVFYEYITGKSLLIPSPEIYTYTLPVLSGRQSGFSGATHIPGLHALLVTASVEDTDNEIDDGAVLGSYAGIIDLESHSIDYAPFTENGELFTGKVESIAIQQKVNNHSLIAIAVTDNDSGASDLLIVEITL
ncbi:hypothetical protein GXP67_25945 [Rhodocytophaga rosea]|uniref:Uncharacterized protein n=1 Tax=Rhodocytophaga rosea TaxID=2704465 RepID=A0A6C0GQK0_9BACT|nr:hypothetical protein [Rhodocytophaga rosea]QHT69842.1 hypothetical protein GXP67_25945 [Rhodocytophaga rosea]